MHSKWKMEKTLLAALCAFGLGACTTSEATDDGTGGTGGVVAPVADAGPIGAAGTTGTTTGGDGILCPAPQQVITDFTYDPAAPGASLTEVRFSNLGNGGEAYYPNSGSYPLTVDVTGNNYHVTGNVGDYSGIGLYFDSCNRIDASMYKGIRFTISGTIAQGSQITFGAGTVGNTTTWTWLKQNGKDTAKETDAGRCTPTSNTQNQYYHPGCEDPKVTLPVTATPVVQEVTWAKLTGGSPNASVNPSELTSVWWSFPWTGSGAAYPVDIVIDDLQFIP